MKLLFISHHTKERCGQRCGDMAVRIAERGHQITVLCISKKKLFGICEHDENGVHYVEVPDLMPRLLRTGWDPWDALNRWWYLRKHLDFDLIHAFETRPTTIHPLLWVLSKKNIPLAIDWIDWWGRGGLITTNRPRWYQLLFGWLETFYEEHFRTLANATTVICTGLGQRAANLGVHPDSIFTMPIGSNTAGIPFVPPNTYRKEFGLNDDDQIAIYSAMHSMMDIELVLKAAHIIKTTHPNFKLLITGNKTRTLTNQIEKYELTEHLIHLGRLPQDEFVKALTCADLFLLPFPDTPYNRGRWPCKLGDYLATGRPVISNPVGDVNLIMKKHQIGILTDAEPQAFACGIRQIFDHPALAEQIQKTARYVAETDLNWEKIIDTLERAYSFALNNASARKKPARDRSRSRLTALKTPTRTTPAEPL